MKPASVALTTTNKFSLLELSTQLGVIVEVDKAVKDNVIGSAGAEAVGANLKNLLVPCALDPIFAINGEATAKPLPAANEFAAKVVESANVGGDVIVIEPAVVAVLLDAIKIDLVCTILAEL